jgi:hypothetical protein
MTSSKLTVTCLPVRDGKTVTRGRKFLKNFRQGRLWLLLIRRLQWPTSHLQQFGRNDGKCVQHVICTSRLFPFIWRRALCNEMTMYIIAFDVPVCQSHTKITICQSAWTTMHDCDTYTYMCTLMYTSFYNIMMELCMTVHIQLQAEIIKEHNSFLKTWYSDTGCPAAVIQNILGEDFDQ